MLILLVCCISSLFLKTAYCYGGALYYVPEDYISKQIEYKVYNTYVDSVALDILSQGIPVETLEEVMLEFFLNQSALCDIVRHVTENGDVTYIPAICTRDCLSPVSKGKYANTSCVLRFPATGVCCAAHNVQWYSHNFQDKSLYEWREMHKVRLHPKLIMMNAEQNRSVFDDFETLNDEKFRSELSAELMCGFRAKKVYRTRYYSTDPLTYDYEYIPFFCVEPDKCSDDSSNTADLKPRPEWHRFCGNRLWYLGTDTKPLKKTRCCHPSFFPQNHFSKKLNSWKFPQFPFYMKYAPGLRSSYMCEYYAKFMCNGTEDNCRSPYTDHYVMEKEFPHMAQLGIVAPKVLKFHCLGSIVSRRYILSAWSCRSIHGIDTNIALLGDDRDPEILQDRQREDLYIISKIYNAYHEWATYITLQFDWEKYLWEPTLYRTSEDILFNQYIRPACLFYLPENRSAEGVFVGLGKNFIYDGTRPFHELYRRIPMEILGTYINHYSDILNCYTQPPYDDKLNPSYARIEKPSPGSWGETNYHIFCAGNETLSPDYGPCQYDLGGSMVVKMDRPFCQWQIIGVLSSNRHNCSRYQHAVFMNVTMFLEPIEDIVWPNPFLDFDAIRPGCGNFTRSIWRESWDEHGGS